VQNLRGVGAELHAGPHLAQRGRLFDELHVLEALAAQGERGGEPADARSGN
jgi:hypothetical protein